MKVKVNRRLSGGAYLVNFEVTDFTTEELQKMASFGVPQITLTFVAGSGRVTSKIPLNQVGKNYEAGFAGEADAKNYEEGVLNQIRDSVRRLRESQDKFTSSEEVAL
jgi:hypothetical protein